MKKSSIALQKNADLHEQLYPYFLLEEYEKITRTIQKLQAQTSTVAIKTQIFLLMETKRKLLADAASLLAMTSSELIQKIKNKTILADKKRILDDIAALRDSLREETGLTIHYASPESKQKMLLAQRTLLVKKIEQLQEAIQQKTEDVYDLLEDLAERLTTKRYTVEEYRKHVIQPLYDRSDAMTKDIAKHEDQGASYAVILRKKDAQKQVLQRIQSEERLLTEPMKVAEMCAKLELSLAEAQQQLSHLDKNIEIETQKMHDVNVLKKECERLFFASYAITHAFYKENLKREKNHMAVILKSDETRYVEKQRDFLAALRNHLQSPSSASIDTLLRRGRAYYPMRAAFDFLDYKPLDNLIKNLATIDPIITQQLNALIHTTQENLVSPDNPDACKEEKKPGSGG